MMYAFAFRSSPHFIRQLGCWIGAGLIAGLLCSQTLADPGPGSEPPPVNSPGADPYQAMPELDNAFQHWSNAFYSAYIQRSSQAQAEHIRDLAGILSPANADQAMQAIARVKTNLSTVKAHFTTPEFVEVLRLLYQYNETATLKSITDFILEHGDPPVRSQNYFLLAKYYNARRQWDGVIAALNQVQRQHLSVADAQYADLLTGYAWQAQRKHRDATRYYQRIPASSPYYPHARLNEGTAYLRQGWWTEAHMEFERAINGERVDPEFKNRTYVVLGHSQLHHEFYRDARNTLRKVALDSAHANKALMGLGVAAAYQQDFAGALNAFTLLSHKPEVDLSVDEAFLLIPPVHHQMGNLVAAGEAYQKAIRHYEQRLKALEQARTSLSDSSSEPVPTLLARMDARADELYGEPHLIPPYMLDNYQQLLVMLNVAPTDALRQDGARLERSYQSVLKDLVKQNIGLRAEMLESYLSQARYGLAQIYDNL